MMDASAISVRNLSKVYRLYDKPIDRLKESLHPFRKKYHREFYALRDVSFEVERGETVGIVGKNGSGKSTLLKIIAGVLTASNGGISVNGKISSLLELGVGFNPELTGIENVNFSGAVIGYSKEQIEEKIENIVAFADIGDFIYQPVKTYSSGMLVRLAFAVQTVVEPDVLIVDEALSVGDEAFSRKCFSRMAQLKAQGVTILFVSHSASTIVSMCDRAILLHHGELILRGKPKFVVSHYQKMIFASEETERALVSSYKAGVNLASSTCDDKCSQSVDTILTDLYDGSLKPQSTIIYESRGAIISNIILTSEDGDPVNILVRRNVYKYRYRVKFTENCRDVMFAMCIKLLNGVELGGARSATHKSELKSVCAGSEYIVEFSFQCLLTPGTYFFNAGVEGRTGDEIVYLHRIIDAYMIKVQPEADIVPTAIVDFLIEPTVVPYTF
jgi:lipopolysaccharide transport system ATP-binding protein